MKYKIDKSDLFIDNKLYPEGSEIELTEEQTKGIEQFLQLCHSELTEGHPEHSEGSQVLLLNKKLNTKGNKK